MDIKDYISMMGPPLIEVDVVDVSDGRLRATKDELEKLGRSKVFSYSMMCGGLNQMVTDITRAAKPKSIKVLRIWGHGTPSVVGISSGQDPRVIRVELTGISPGAMANPHQQLGLLKPFFAAKARLELRGCETGAGADAERLMNQLADLLGVEVHASPDDQAMYGLDWFGNVFVAVPGTPHPPLRARPGIAVGN
jgi:hypothetical protein